MILGKDILTPSARPLFLTKNLDTKHNKDDSDKGLWTDLGLGYLAAGQEGHSRSMTLNVHITILQGVHYILWVFINFKIYSGLWPLSVFPQ